MRVFDYSRLPNDILTPNICRLLGAIHEYKGKQDLFITAKADVLRALLDVAKIQSTAASNRIENIAVSPHRLTGLMSERIRPRDRNEQEIAGYRDVLNLIHEGHDAIPIRPSTLLQLHKELYSHQPDGIGGHWKNSDNVISEIDGQGRRIVRFRPLSAVETPIAMETLCETFTHAIEENVHDGLLLIPLFILDFLSIHPFNDGNGRMSRLLTLLLLYKAGYIVGKYISLEQVVERSKESYYEALARSSERWRQGKNDPKPFIEYLLGTILKSYRLFEERVSGLIDFKVPKTGRIRALFDHTPTPLTKRMILAKCPDISESTIEATLRTLRKANVIRKIGERRNASYLLAETAKQSL